jgi:hypothetical protein
MQTENEVAQEAIPAIIGSRDNAASFHDPFSF